MIRHLTTFCAVVGLCACAHGDRSMPSIPLTSSAFTAGAAIPARFTCDSTNISPPLGWSGTPAHAVSLALVVDDPDAPGGTFVHWVLYDMPTSLHALSEGIARAGAPAPATIGREAKNGFGNVGYGGPCPPAGQTHHYRFQLYALDTTLALPSGAPAKDVIDAIRGHAIARGELVGTYVRHGGATPP